MKNENPKEFENVKIYAGDKHHEAADAEMRNFKVCSLDEGLEDHPSNINKISKFLFQIRHHWQQL